MGVFNCFGFVITKCLRFFCPPIHGVIFSKLNEYRCLKKFVCFTGGFVLGQLYYHCVLKKIQFPYHVEFALPLILSLLLGLGNIISTQIRCICLLLLPMYCGTAGRSVLKAVVLTYVVAGPITNMGLNAKEVVRVFACSTQLSYNLSKYKHHLIYGPLRDTARSLATEIEQVKDALRSIEDVLKPIEHEIGNMDVLPPSRLDNDYIDDVFESPHRSDQIERKYYSMQHIDPNSTISEEKLEEQEISDYQTRYLKKLESECERQLSRAVDFCLEIFSGAFEQCFNAMPIHDAWELCRPLKLMYVCKIMDIMRKDDLCDSTKHIDTGLGQGYAYLIKAKTELTKKLDDIKLQYKVTNELVLYDIQDSKETGERVKHAFEEKMITMHMVITAVNIWVALLFLRIVVAAVTYHDMFLTDIDYDNVYITGYFKRLDKRRRMKNQITILPLKKMERSKYIDVDSIAYMSTQRNKLLTQILKVMLEMVTATTFVMLDRLFYEALDVVRQHAEADVAQESTRDLEIEVDGNGIVSNIISKLIDGVKSKQHTVTHNVSNKECVPHPSLMPPMYFVRIYGGYVWIILLLCINPYTLRLRRLFSSYFYPRREKQRILHLYNDILKKRMKMDKTLRRKAVQAVRAHYLSGENLLSMRIKFPHLLGWLRMIPVARMTCLICGQTEPRNNHFIAPGQAWHSCALAKCPFVYCAECWSEVGERCLACDPSLAELSDIDSLSEDEQPRY